jgi:hypothetical protein
MTIPVWEQDATHVWYDGPLLGNGDLGIVAFGAMDRLTFALGKNDFWDRRYEIKNYTPRSLQAYAAGIARRAAAGDADKLHSDDAPITSHGFPLPKPLARMRIWKEKGRHGSTQLLKPIHHVLSLQDGELTTSSPHLSTIARVQKGCNLVVIHLTGGRGTTLLSLQRVADEPNMGIVIPIHTVDDTIGLMIQDLPPDVAYPDGFRGVVAAALIDGSIPHAFPQEIVWRIDGACTLILATATTRDHAQPEDAAKALLRDAPPGGQTDARRRPRLRPRP